MFAEWSRGPPLSMQNVEGCAGSASTEPHAWEKGRRRWQRWSWRDAPGVDASSTEQVTLHQRNRHPGTGEPAGRGRSGLIGADNDRIEAPVHFGTNTMTIAVRIATASSINAAGRSLRKVKASFARAAYPPSVPITAPTIPAIPPTISQPTGAPIAAPESAPETMRAPNPPGALRLGAEGNWSMTSSTSARRVRIHGVQAKPKKASGPPPSDSQPKCAAQLTAVGAVKVRRPAGRACAGAVASLSGARDLARRSPNRYPASPAADNRLAVEAQIRSLRSDPLPFGMQPSLTLYRL